MANPLQTLIPFFSFIAAFFFFFFNKVHSQDVTSFTYDIFPAIPNVNGLTYQGDARVLPGSPALSLAGINATGSSNTLSVGRVLYSRPVQLWESSSARQSTFETTITFRIRPSRNGAAEGVVFFITPVGTVFPDSSSGGNLGVYNGGTPTIFAVEFDTNYNGWDPNYHHMGINIQSRTSSRVARFNAGTGQEITARINYDSSTRTITAVATSASQSASLSYVFDLKTFLPEQVQVGISSSTGRYISAAGFPEIRSWYFISVLVSDAAVDEKAANIRRFGSV